MSEVVVDNPRRVRNGGSLDVDDFSDIGGCTAVYWGRGGALVVEFDRDLTADEQAAVVLRVSSTGPADEALRRQAANVLDSLDDLPNGASLPQVIAQLQALKQEVTALARIVLQDHEETQ